MATSHYNFLMISSHIHSVTLHMCSFPDLTYTRWRHNISAKTRWMLHPAITGYLCTPNKIAWMLISVVGVHTANNRQSNRASGRAVSPRKGRTVGGQARLVRLGLACFLWWPRALGERVFAEAALSVCQETTVEDIRGWDVGGLQGGPSILTRGLSIFRAEVTTGQTAEAK